MTVSSEACWMRSSDRLMPDFLVLLCCCWLKKTYWGLDHEAFYQFFTQVVEIGKRAYDIYARVDYVSEIERVTFLIQKQPARKYRKKCSLFGFVFIAGTRRAPNPNLQVVITHALHVYSQHSFGLPLRMNGMYRTQFDHVRLDFLSLVIWSRVFCHVKLPQSTTTEQNRFDFLSLCWKVITTVSDKNGWDT